MQRVNFILFFEIAYKGYSSLRNENLIGNIQFLTIVDYSKALTKKRFFVIDLKNEVVVFKELVAHAINSGDNYAKPFSNETEFQEEIV